MGINHKYIFEIKESLFIKRERPVLNKNISSAKLFLYDTFNVFIIPQYCFMLFDMLVTVKVT